MRRFLGSLPSSFSLSLASLFVPATLPAALLGVSGGVVNGTPVTLPEFAAAMLGTFPVMSEGLLTTLVFGTVDVWVAIEDAELDLAGEEGRGGAVDVDAGGEGAVKELTELRCWCCDPLGKGDGGANVVVGVGCGVLWFDDDVAAGTDFGGPTSPL